MAVKFIKITQRGGQAISIKTKSPMPKSCDTIKRKRPYKWGLCYRQKHPKGSLKKKGGVLDYIGMKWEDEPS